MKTKTVILLLIIALFSITACGSSNVETQEVPEEEVLTQGVNADLNLLTLGILKLNSTEMAVSSEQAQTLLPYLQLLKSLLSSDTAAQEEIDAVTAAIQSEMTNDQMAFINSIDLETTPIIEQLSALGIEIARGGIGGGEFDGAAPEGGIPSGGIPGQGRGQGGGQGGLPEGVEISPEEQATREARMAERTGGSGIIVQLVDALITYLESK